MREAPLFRYFGRPTDRLIFGRVCLPAHLVPDNLPAMRAVAPVRFHVYCGPADWARLSEVPIRDRRRHVAAVIQHEISQGAID